MYTMNYGLKNNVPMKEIRNWLVNSKRLSEKVHMNYKALFVNELEMRKVVAKHSKITSDFKIMPNYVIGTYKIMGQNPDADNSCYIGLVEIDYVEGQWQAVWEVSGNTHYGFGMQVVPNVLIFSFSYIDSEDNVHSGIASYTFVNDDIVRGEWIEDGYPDKGYEELRKMTKEEVDNDNLFDTNYGFSLN